MKNRPQFEYKALRIAEGYDIAAIEATANRWAAEGWRVVTVWSSIFPVLILERELGPLERRIR